jgi:hypothetical protein
MGTARLVADTEQAIDVQNYTSGACEDNRERLIRVFQVASQVT